MANPVMTSTLSNGYLPKGRQPAMTRSALINFSSGERNLVKTLKRMSITQFFLPSLVNLDRLRKITVWPHDLSNKSFFKSESSKKSKTKIVFLNWYYLLNFCLERLRWSLTLIDFEWPNKSKNIKCKICHLWSIGCIFLILLTK